MKQHSVLTGDIVASSDLTEDEINRIMDALHEAARSIATWGGSEDVTAGFRRTGGFGRRGGDGWQIALDNPGFAFRSTLFCQAAVRRLHDDWETRIAVATGDGNLPPPDYDPNKGYGPVFTASGRKLETMDRYARFAHDAGGAEAASYRLADQIAAGWTSTQARALYEVLPPGAGPRAEAAEALGVSREAVNQALWAAGYRALEDALRFMETGA